MTQITWGIRYKLNGAWHWCMDVWLGEARIFDRKRDAESWAVLSYHSSYRNGVSYLPNLEFEILPVNQEED